MKDRERKGEKLKREKKNERKTRVKVLKKKNIK